MSRRLRDPLLALFLLVEALVQYLLAVPGDTVATVGASVHRYNAEPVLAQLGQRSIVAVVVGLYVGALPLLARRSARRWRGRPTRPGGLAVLWDAPWHRDPVLWIAGVLATVPLTFVAGPGGSGDFSEGPGQVSRSTETVTGNYLDLLQYLPACVGGFLVVAVALGAARLVFRLLGGSHPRQQAGRRRGAAR